MKLQLLSFFLILFITGCIAQIIAIECSNSPGSHIPENVRKEYIEQVINKMKLQTPPDKRNDFDAGMDEIRFYISQLSFNPIRDRIIVRCYISFFLICIVLLTQFLLLKRNYTLNKEKVIVHNKLLCFFVRWGIVFAILLIIFIFISYAGFYAIR